MIWWWQKAVHHRDSKTMFLIFLTREEPLCLEKGPKVSLCVDEQSSKTMGLEESLQCSVTNDQTIASSRGFSMAGSRSQMEPHLTVTSPGSWSTQRELGPNHPPCWRGKAKGTLWEVIYPKGQVYHENSRWYPTKPGDDIQLNLKWRGDCWNQKLEYCLLASLNFPRYSEGWGLWRTMSGVKEKRSTFFFFFLHISVGVRKFCDCYIYIFFDLNLESLFEDYSNK